MAGERSTAESAARSAAPTRGEDLLRAVREIHTRGWCLGTGGNFSVVNKRRPLELLITRSGRDKGRLRHEDLLIVAADGEPVDGVGRPSAETLVHTTIATRTDTSADVDAILHTHSVAGTLLSEHFLDDGGFHLTGYEMLKGLEGIRTHRAKVFVPILANAQDMRRFSGRVAALLAQRPRLHGFLIAGHGLYTWGASLEEACRHVEIFEFLFECIARRTRFRPYVTEDAATGDPAVG